jgi:hypothetical protein
VSVTDLRGEAPVVLRDSLTTYDLAIDFSWPPERIAAALTEVLQECVDSCRWKRAGAGDRTTDDEPPPVTASH